MTTSTDFKSPTRKLVSFFQSSRDGWKSKCLEAKYELKLLKRKHARLNRRYQELVQQCNQLEELKTQSQQRRPRNSGDNEARPAPSRALR